jgi:CheY-like chemotaxis protein
MQTSGCILIVDKNASAAEAIRLALGVCREMEGAGTGGLRTISGRPPDLALVDYRLPDKAAPDPSRFTEEKRPSVSVILLAAVGSEEVREESSRPGGRDHARRPPAPPEPVARVQNLAPARQRMGELRSPVFPDDLRPRPASGDGSRAASLQRAIAFIDEHLETPLKLIDVAREAGMSESRFCRAFKEFTGVTFREHVGRRRVVRAADLLRNRIPLLLPPQPLTASRLLDRARLIRHLGRLGMLPHFVPGPHPQETIQGREESQ